MAPQERVAEKNTAEEKVSVPKGVWSKCEGCGEITYTEELIQNLRVCPVCGHHAPMPTSERIAAMLDDGTWSEEDLDIRSGDPLGFVDSKAYDERLKKARRTAGPGDAFRSGTGSIGDVPVSVGFFAFEFMGGSMGSVVGEKVTRVFERAVELHRPAVVFSASGGARMQEGVLSLMQMAKTSAARAKLRDVGLPYVSVVLHPTTGGVAASFSMLGDVIFAEPKALVGFAGAAGDPADDRAGAAQGISAGRVPARARDGRSDHQPAGDAGADRAAAAAAGHAAARAGRMSFEALFARRTFGIRPGLDAVRPTYAALGEPCAGVPAVHIVGTNGKGSVAAMAAAALSDRAVGLYTSPHLRRCDRAGAGARAGGRGS